MEGERDSVRVPAVIVIIQPKRLRRKWRRALRVQSEIVEKVSVIAVPTFQMCVGCKRIGCVLFTDGRV
jgi:hypothetical protein